MFCTIAPTIAWILQILGVLFIIALVQAIIKYTQLIRSQKEAKQTINKIMKKK